MLKDTPLYLAREIQQVIYGYTKSYTQDRIMNPGDKAELVYRPFGEYNDELSPYMVLSAASESEDFDVIDVYLSDLSIYREPPSGTLESYWVYEVKYTVNKVILDSGRDARIHRMDYFNDGEVWSIRGGTFRIRNDGALLNVWHELQDMTHSKD